MSRKFLGPAGQVILRCAFLNLRIHATSQQIHFGDHGKEDYGRQHSVYLPHEQVEHVSIVFREATGDVGVDEHGVGCHGYTFTIATVTLSAVGVGCS